MKEKRNNNNKNNCQPFSGQDNIGRPIQAYDDKGNIIWETDYDIYGNLENLKGGRKFIPFRYQGQYEDEEN